MASTSRWVFFSVLRNTFILISMCPLVIRNTFRFDGNALVLGLSSIVTSARPDRKCSIVCVKNIFHGRTHCVHSFIVWHLIGCILSQILIFDTCVHCTSSYNVHIISIHISICCAIGARRVPHVNTVIAAHKVQPAWLSHSVGQVRFRKIIIAEHTECSYFYSECCCDSCFHEKNDNHVTIDSVKATFR